MPEQDAGTEGSRNSGFALQDSESRHVRARGVSLLWPVAAVAAVAYGSLLGPALLLPVPSLSPAGAAETSASSDLQTHWWVFGIDRSILERSIGQSFELFQTSITSIEDVITNILVYIPIGLAVVLCVRRRGNQVEDRKPKVDSLPPRPLTSDPRPSTRTTHGQLAGPSRWRRVGIAVLIGAVLSLLVELLQTGIAARVASWTDVIFNVFGAAAGAVLGVGLIGPGRSAAAWLRRHLAARPYATLGSLLTLALLLYGLAPFDFVTDTEGLHASFRRARWDLTSVRTPGLGEPPLAMLVAQLTGAAWFAVLGYVLALARSKAERPTHEGLVAALTQGVALAAVVEFMQLFTLSHRFDLGSLALRVLAVMFGVWFALFMMERVLDPRWRRRPCLAAPTGLLAGVILFQVLAILLSAANPGQWSIADVGATRMQWIPFLALWYRPMANVATEVLSVLVVYGTLSLTVGVLLRRLRLGRAGLVTLAIVGLVASLPEAMQLVSTAGTPDLTSPLVACAAFAGVAALYPPFRRAVVGIPR